MQQVMVLNRSVNRWTFCPYLLIYISRDPSQKLYLFHKNQDRGGDHSIPRVSICYAPDIDSLQPSKTIQKSFELDSMMNLNRIYWEVGWASIKSVDTGTKI